MINKLIFQFSIVVLMLSSCNLFKKTDDKTIYISAETKPCTSGEMQKECMLVKWTTDQAEWELFYDQIEGFTYENGYEYELVVSQEKVKNPPADASSMKYKLVKEVSKTKIEPAGMATGDNSQNALDWQGTYQGTLPCADCYGIKMSLTLNRDNSYSMTEEYLGKSKKVFDRSGKFEWSDDGGSISIQDGDSKYFFKVGENQLFKLSLEDRKVIEGKLADQYILHKTETLDTHNNQSSAPGFEDKKWQLIEFRGAQVNGSADDYFITFNSKDKRLNTKVGCNNISASYELKNELELKIGPAISTKMACQDNKIEDEYVKSFESVNNVTYSDKLLHLNSARMIVATFKLQD